LATVLANHGHQVYQGYWNDDYQLKERNAKCLLVHDLDRQPIAIEDEALVSLPAICYAFSMLILWPHAASPPCTFTVPCTRYQPLTMQTPSTSTTTTSLL